jgi:hypothetical protein
MKRLVFLIPMLALAACQGGGGTPTDTPLAEKSTFQDVPAPPNLAYDSGTGRTTPGGIRVYTQEYSGKARPEEVTKFYRDVLPQHGWTAAGEEGSGPWKMTFKKGNEQATIDVTSTADGVKVKVKLDYKQ